MFQIPHRDMSTSKCQCYGEAMVNSPYWIVGFKTTKKSRFKLVMLNFPVKKQMFEATKNDGSRTAMSMATEATKGVSSRSRFKVNCA